MALSPSEKFSTGAKLYCLWAALAISGSLAIAGLSAESMTRLMVLAFIAGQFLFRASLVKALPRLAPRTRFIVLGTLFAAVVEGFHMISKPVFASLLVLPDLPLARGLHHYALDLLFTVPAYLVIFAVIWFFINRYRYGLWTYIVVMGLAQALGDGGIFYFMNAPQMLFFLPYPMTNYHAINVMPFLAVRDELNVARARSYYSYLAVPALIGTYLVCGAIIKAAGRVFGLEPG